MKVFTDYPFDNIDEPYKEAPIREVVIVAYDGNKYCEVKFGEVYQDVKRGYLYKTPCRCGDEPCLTENEVLQAIATINKVLGEE